MAKRTRPIPRPRAKPNQQNTLVVNWYGEDIAKALHGQMNEALRMGAQVLIDAATPKAPKDSGMLQESGYVATRDESTYHFDTKSHEKEVRPEYDGVAVAAFAAPHAHLIEFGTANMKAQPFFRPAFDETRREIVVTAGKELREALGDDDIG